MLDVCSVLRQESYLQMLQFMKGDVAACVSSDKNGPYMNLINISKSCITFHAFFPAGVAVLVRPTLVGADGLWGPGLSHPHWAGGAAVVAAEGHRSIG